MVLRRIATAAFAVGVCLSACATQPKQARPDLDSFKESGDDIAKEEEAPGTEPVILTADQKKGICCKQCDEALAADKTGDAPDKIPCSDFTADLKEDCLKFFRKSPMMASEAKACAADAPAPTSDGEASEGG